MVEVCEPDGLQVEFAAVAGRTRPLVTLTVRDVRAGDDDLVAVRRSAYPIPSTSVDRPQPQGSSPPTSRMNSSKALERSQQPPDLSPRQLQLVDEYGGAVARSIERVDLTLQPVTQEGQLSGTGVTNDIPLGEPLPDAVADLAEGDARVVADALDETQTDGFAAEYLFCFQKQPHRVDHQTKPTHRCGAVEVLLDDALFPVEVRHWTSPSVSTTTQARRRHPSQGMSNQWANS